MLYVSDRNHGCRFKEIYLNGIRSLILENEKLSILLLLDKGGEIVEFTYKPTDTGLLWRSKNGLSSISDRHVSYNDFFYQAYTGGWFEAFPNVGMACKYNGIEFKPYDEVKNLPWEYSVLKDDSQEITLKLWVKTLKTPFYLTKYLTLKSNLATLFIEETAENIGKETAHYTWSHHPVFSTPFIDEHCLIDMPGGKINTHFEHETSRLVQGSIGEWPIMEGKTGKVDLRNFPEEKAGVSDFLWMSDLRSNWVAIRNTKKNIGLGMAWDQKQFENCLLWINAGGCNGFPHYGHDYLLCVMPSSTDIHTLNEAVNKKTSSALEQGEKTNSWINLSVFEGAKHEVIDINQEANISFNS